MSLDRDAVLALVGRLQSEGATVPELISQLLAPALVELGRRWADGEVGSAHSQAATAIVRAALPRVPMPHIEGLRPVAVCCADREHHDLPAEMFTELLRAEGWPAQHIGAVTPQQLPSFLTAQRPSALLVSCTTPCGLPGAARAIQVAHGRGVPVVVGGAAFGLDSLRAVRLGAAAWAPNARRAVEVLSAWNGAPLVICPPRELTGEYRSFERGWTEIKTGALEAFRRATPDDHTDPAGLHAAHDRLELVLQHLGAALLVDDGRLFHEFLSWRATYYRARNISPTRLVAGLTAIATSLPGDAERARVFIMDGLQHLAWTTMVPGQASSDSDDVPGQCPAGSAASRPVVALRPAAAPGLAAGFVGDPAKGVAGASDLSDVAAGPGPARGPVAPPGRSGGLPGTAASLPGTAPGPAGGSPGRPGSDQPGRVFADLLFVAAMTCRAPVALISVRRPDGRWSTLSHGTERRDLLVDDELMTAISEGTGPLEIADLSRHSDLSGSALVRDPLAIRFVYGIPLRNRQSVLLGVLGILDRRPRELSSRERQAITAIARQVGTQLSAWRRGGGSQSGPGEVGGGQEAATVIRPEPRLAALRESEPELLRSHEVAVLFDVTERTVINWAAAKRLPVIRTAGGHLRFRADDVLALLAGRSTAEGSRVGSVGA